MSMGWLTESSLIPKPAVPINVNNSSILDLKVVLMKDKKDTEQGVMKAKQFSKKNIKKNKGIEERLKNDSAEITKNDDYHKLSMAQHILKKKTEIYEKQQQNGISMKNSLVDFQLKQIDSMTEQEKEEYERQKQEFFYQKKAELNNSKNLLLNSRAQIADPCLGFSQALQDMERNEWEQQMLKELETDLKEANKELHERVMVKQTYDKKLTDLEKQKLLTVIEDEIEAKDKLNELKRKRQEMQIQRRENLKKIKK